MSNIVFIISMSHILLGILNSIFLVFSISVLFMFFSHQSNIVSSNISSDTSSDLVSNNNSIFISPNLIHFALVTVISPS